MQYAFLEKKIYTVYNGVWCMGQSFRSWGVFEIMFVLKITLKTIRLHLTVSYRREGGCITCSPNNLFWGSSHSLPPGYRACRTYGNAVSADNT